MGDSRRPRRTKKEVSYTSFNHSDDDDDDGDFATFTPPAPKKSKSEKNGKKQADKTKSKDLKRKAPKERKAVDDRIFDKELELALEMSVIESSSQSQEISQNEKETSRPAAEVLVEVHNPGADKELGEVESELASKTAEMALPIETEQKAKVKVNQETILRADEIDLIETLEDEEEGSKNTAGRRRRKAAQKASSKQKALLVEDGDDDDNEDGESDADDDFKADEDDFSDSDEGNIEDDEDEDFSFSPKKKKRKGNERKTTKKEAVSKNKRQPSKKQTKAPREGNENKSPPTRMKKVSAGIRGQSKGFTPPTLTKSSDTKSPSLPVSRQIKRKPVVMSPKDSNGNNPLGGVKLVSPGQPFRLGLSRFARVKPLHANPKVP